MPTVTDVWPDVHQERQALLELLETLTPEQWDAPSLCAEWRVRDVVGHMVSETDMTVTQAVWGSSHQGSESTATSPRTPDNEERPPLRSFLRTSEMWFERARICPACHRCPCSKT